MRNLFQKPAEETLEDVIRQEQEKLASPAEQKKLAAEAQEKQAAAAASFNVASGIAEGLAKLQAIPGSKFTFTEAQKSTEGYVIHTNIQRDGKEMDIDIRGVGPGAAAFVHVAGSKRADSGADVEWDAPEKIVAKRIVFNIARKAVRAGLIPKL